MFFLQVFCFSDYFLVSSDLLYICLTSYLVSSRKPPFSLPILPGTQPLYSHWSFLSHSCLLVVLHRIAVKQVHAQVILDIFFLAFFLLLSFYVSLRSIRWLMGSFTPFFEIHQSFLQIMLGVFSLSAFTHLWFVRRPLRHCWWISSPLLKYYHYYKLLLGLSTYDVILGISVDFI